MECKGIREKREGKGSVRCLPRKRGFPIMVVLTGGCLHAWAHHPEEEFCDGEKHPPSARLFKLQRMKL
jgi:hypothetical protein